MFRGWAKSCERVDDTSKPNHSSQGPGHRFPSRRGQVSLFLDGLWRDKGAKSFLSRNSYFLQTFVAASTQRVVLSSRRQEERSVFSFFRFRIIEGKTFLLIPRFIKSYLVLRKSGSGGSLESSKRPKPTIPIVPSRSSCAWILAVSPRALLFRKLSDEEKTQITKLFFLPNTSLWVGFN